MHAISFIQDLAVIMLVAGVVTILFHRFKQPVVWGTSSPALSSARTPRLSA
jgi:Kef-type K+ transport system membrane component KefB